MLKGRRGGKERLLWEILKRLGLRSHCACCRGVGKMAICHSSETMDALKKANGMGHCAVGRRLKPLTKARN